MGECHVEHNPAILTCVGLGSCVGVVLYDAIKKLGGLAHVMLPKQCEAKNQSPSARFADTAIELLLKEMADRGSTLRNVKAKIFGGANMFPDIVRPNAVMNVGERNIRAVKQELRKRKLEIIGEDLGGQWGRSIFFNTADGSVRVRNVLGEQKLY